MASSESTNFFTNALYDRLKFVALVFLPAVGTLYFAVAQIWGLPKATEVVGTIGAIDAFLGVILQLSAKNYYQNDGNFAGTLLVQDAPDQPELSLALNGEPEDLPGRHSVEFNVRTVR